MKNRMYGVSPLNKTCVFYLYIYLRGFSLFISALTTKYIKFLISRETYSFIERVPEYPLPKRIAKLAKTALDEHRAGKSIELKNVDDLDNL